jgi:alpha-galactosidase
LRRSNRGCACRPAALEQRSDNRLNLFIFRVIIPDPANLPIIYLRGLDPDALYQMDGYEQPRSGIAWMAAGIKIHLLNLRSKLLRIRRVA